MVGLDLKTQNKPVYFCIGEGLTFDVEHIRIHEYH